MGAPVRTRFLGSNGVPGGGLFTSLTLNVVNPPGSTTQGLTAILTVYLSHQGFSTVAVTDSRGNTWTVDRDSGGHGSPGTYLAVCSAREAATLQAGDTITVTVTGGTFVVGAVSA